MSPGSKCEMSDCPGLLSSCLLPRLSSASFTCCQGPSERWKLGPARNYPHLVHEIRLALFHLLNHLHFRPALLPNHAFWSVPWFGSSSGQPILIATGLGLYELLSTAKGLSCLSRRSSHHSIPASEDR